MKLQHFEHELMNVDDQPSDEKIASKSDDLHHKAEETHRQCECASIDLFFVHVTIPKVSLEYVVTPVELTGAQRGLDDCCWNNSTARCMLCSIAFQCFCSIAHSFPARCMLCSIAL